MPGYEHIIEKYDKIWQDFISFKKSEAWALEKAKKGYIISEDCRKCKSILKFCYVKEESEHIKTLFQAEIETPIVIKGTNIRFFTPNGNDFRLQIKNIDENINLCLPTNSLDGNLLEGEKKKIFVSIDNKNGLYIIRRYKTDK